jgi:hypothetical protein
MRRKSGPLTATIMHHDPKEPMLTVIGSFNGLMPRMANLDHAGILISGRKLLKQAKKQRTEPTMRMSEVILMTGMQNEDLETFISCLLITVTDSPDDSVLSLRDVFCLLKNNTAENA